MLSMVQRMTGELNVTARASRRLRVAVVLLAAVALPAPAGQAALVYQAAGQQVIAAADDGSQARTLAHGIDPTVSPNGRWVTYVTRDRKRVVLVPFGGGARRVIARLRHGESLNETRGGTAWSRDSKLVATTAIGQRLIVYDLATGASRTRVSETPDLAEPAFSPSGKRVAYTQLLDVSGFLGWVTARGARNGTMLKFRNGGPRMGTTPVWGPRGVAMHEFDGNRYDNGILNSFVFVSDSTGRRGHRLPGSKDCFPVAWVSSDVLLAERALPTNRVQPVYLGIDRQPVAALPDSFSWVGAMSADHESILALDGDSILRVKLKTGASQLLGHGVAPSWSG
jgi:hypothetical protein